MSSKDECKVYFNLDYQRNINDGVIDQPYCDQRSSGSKSVDWIGTRWYRFTGPSGTRIPTENPGEYRCGTRFTGWLKGRHPRTPDTTIDAKVCFNGYQGECSKSVDVKITNCNSYFVYYLPDTPECNLRYCATNDRF